MRHLIREGKSASKVLQTQIDRAVALADQEVGIRHAEFSMAELPCHPPHLGQSAPPTRPTPAQSRHRAIAHRPTPGGLPVAPMHRGSSHPAAGTAFPWRAYTERIRAGWVPVMGLPGTPITSGFIRDLGEYNPKLEGMNGIWTYQEMRRGDGQVAGTLRACKLPILSAQWEIVPGDERDTGSGTGHGRTAVQSRVRSPPERADTATRPKRLPTSFATNLFSGLEWQDHRGLVAHAELERRGALRAAHAGFWRRLLRRSHGH